MQDLYEKLNFARRELLDLSFKNPLVNFKLRKTTGLELIGINASELFEYLVNENKSSYFTAIISY